MMGAGVWSKAEIEIARRLWNEEGKTAEQIASAIGRQPGIYRTRSAVLGRINRMPGIFVRRGKSGGAKDLVQAKRIIRNRASARAVVSSPSDTGSDVPLRSTSVTVSTTHAVRTVTEMIAGMGGGISRDKHGHAIRAKSLVDLDVRECRFPVAGDQPADLLFCAAVIHPDDWRPWTVGGCYCCRHREIAGAGFSSPGTFVDRRARAT